MKSIWIHDNLRYLMAAKNIKQKDLAAAMNWPQSSITNYLKDKYPDAKRLMKLANFFDVNIDDLIRKDLSKDSKPSNNETNDHLLTKLLSRLESQLEKVENDKSVSDKKLLEIMDELERNYPEVYKKLNLE